VCVPDGSTMKPGEGGERAVQEATGDDINDYDSTKRHMKTDVCPVSLHDVRARDRDNKERVEESLAHPK